PLAALAGPVLEAGRQRRDRAAALNQLQAPLLPARPDALPELPGVELGVAHRPAAGELAVGGDFYLIRQTPDGDTLFALGDVCGKGAEALAESSRVQHSLAALMVVEQEPARLLHLLNRALLAAGRTVFTTLVLGALQPTSVGLRLTLAAGGHPAPMVLRGGGHVEEVGVPGTVLGILPDARFGRTAITLKLGETCLLYSDGATEAGRRTGEHEEQFGPARLAGCLSGCAGMTAQAVATRVKDTVTDWLGRNDGDDLAVLAVRAVARDTG
ncbi:MAG: PP2C family protein-serine/threonine phosphatase, partial [Pseudonocardiaceae bacterium]